MESPPIPSPADAGFLLFPVLAMVGVLALLRARTRDVPTTLLDRRLDRRAGGHRGQRRDRLRDRARGRSTASRWRSPRRSPTRSPTWSCSASLVGALASTGWRLDRTWVAARARHRRVLARRLAVPRADGARARTPRRRGSTSAGTLGLLLVGAAPRGSRRVVHAADDRRTACASSRPARLRRGRPRAAVYGCLTRDEPAGGRARPRCRWSRSWRG